MAAASEDSKSVEGKISVEEIKIEVSEKNSFIKLTDLKVAELKCELEKRDLDKNGVKSVLIERLKTALLEEGKDPEAFSFSYPNDTSKSKSLQRKKNSDSETNGEVDASNNSVEFSCETEDVLNSNTSEFINAKANKSTDTVLNENSELEIPSESSEINESLNLESNKSDSEISKLEDSETNKLTDSEENEVADYEQNAMGDSEEHKLTDSEDFQCIALEKFKVIDSAESESDGSEEHKVVDPEFTEDVIQKEKLKSNDLGENECVSEENRSVNSEANKSDDSENNNLVDLKVNNSTDDVNNSAELEIDNAEYLELSNSEDKMNCEITLQLSIDEEDAQLNEDENIVEIPKSIEETELKSEEVKPTFDANCNTIAAEASIHTPPVKANSVSEGSKERKIAKTPVHPKSFESNVSPKVLKVIGKNDKMKNANVLAKSLWVTSLPTTTRAADLKTLFSKQGRVLSVKIVKSTKQTPGKCYGFVTMANSTDATKAIQNLHHTEFNGRTISVERTQSEPGALLKKSESKLTTGTKKQLAKKETTKATEAAKLNSESKTSSKSDTKSGEKKCEETTDVKENKRKLSEKGKSKEKDQKSRDIKERDSRRPFRRPPSSRTRPFTFHDRPRFGTFGRRLAPRTYASRSGIGSTGFRPRSDASLYDRIREERIRQRDRFRERERRELERRRAIEISRQRYIERKQREEAYRLEREKEKLRIERELLERERAEMLKMEREKQLLERARLEREREALRRQAEIGRSIKRPRVVREADVFWGEKKKSRYEDRSSFHGDKLRDVPSSTSRYEFPSRESSRTIGRHEYEHHPERISSSKAFVRSSRSDFGDRDIRREVSMRSRDERRVFERSDVRDRDHRRSIGSRERHSSSRREKPRSMDWKHERRVHEKVVIPRNSGQRRMTYY